EIGKFSRQRFEHFYVKECSFSKTLAQVGEGRAVGKKIFLPGDVVSHTVAKSLLDLAALLHPPALVKITVAAQGKDDHQVPMIALRVAHPERGFIACRLDSGSFGFVEVNQFQ